MRLMLLLIVHYCVYLVFGTCRASQLAFRHLDTNHNGYLTAAELNLLAGLGALSASTCAVAAQAR